MSSFMNVFNQIFELVNEMSPYLLLGFLIAGLLHAFVPNSLYSKYLSGNSFRSVINAAIFGIPLPLCSCGVIPTAMSLKREGASKGATVSFLIATPQTGVDSIFATYSLMGLPFAVVRPIAALLTAVLGGQFVNMYDEKESAQDAESAHRQHTEAGYSEKKGLSFFERMKEAFKFGFVEMMSDIGKWLVIGLIVAGLITVLVPDSFFEVFKDNTLMSMLLVLCISIPMYLCATGSIPIAVALMLKGLTPGAALVLLMAGPASNAASILVINKVLGKKTLILYLGAIVFGAIVSGILIDTFLPREWFVPSMVSADADCCGEGQDIFNIICSVILALLLLNTLRLRFAHKDVCGCGHCHDHEHSDGHKDNCTCNADQTKIYHIEGMNCNHCRANAERALLSVRGVESVSVDLQTGEAKVEGEDVDENEIRSAIESLGFSVA